MLKRFIINKIENETNVEISETAIEFLKEKTSAVHKVDSGSH